MNVGHPNKILMPVCAAALALLASACNTSHAAPGDPGAKHVGKKIAIVENQQDGYNIQMACGAVAEGKALGFNMEQPQGPKSSDATQQVSLLTATLARNPDGLVVAPSDSTTALVPLKSAAASGLKIATIDSNLADPSVATTFIASDPAAGGALAAREVAREVGGSGKVLTESLIPDHPILKPRVDGFANEIKMFPGIQYLGARWPEPDLTKIVADTAGMLQKNPDIKVIYTTNNYSTPAVITAIHDAGLQGKVHVVTWDFDEVALKYLKSGDISAVVTQEPRQIGVEAMMQLANAFDGKPVTKMIRQPVTLVTSADYTKPALAKLYYGTSC
jgi:ribose transport system substrate-binding protein